MPRLIHKVPRYAKHRASGQAVVTLNGKDRYLGLPKRLSVPERERWTDRRRRGQQS